MKLALGAFSLFPPRRRHRRSLPVFFIFHYDKVSWPLLQAAPAEAPAFRRATRRI